MQYELQFKCFHANLYLNKSSYGQSYFSYPNFSSDQCCQLFFVENPQILVENPQILVENPQILVENPQILVENPQILVENPRILVENPQIFSGIFF